MAKQSHDNYETLSELLEEIRYRTSFAATAIQLAITERIRELESIREHKRRDQQRGQKEKGTGKSNEKSSAPDSEADKLRRQLNQANEQIASLKAQLKNANSDEENLFRRVGLNKDCPDFVVRSVRTAYRKALHPDSRPEGQKKEAHRRFIDVENIFEKIFRLRNL